MTIHACLCACTPLHLRSLQDTLAQTMLGLLHICRGGATAPDLAEKLQWALSVMRGMSWPFLSSACTRCIVHTLVLAVTDTLQGVCISEGADCQVALEVKSFRIGKGTDGAGLDRALDMVRMQQLHLTPSALPAL